LWEQLGEETLLYCQMKGKEGELIASVKGLLVYQNGQDVSLSFNFEHVCLFDKESEKSLLNE
jgi:ABC-type sugar transport system ATPase subunit